LLQAELAWVKLVVVCNSAKGANLVIDVWMAMLLVM
jgi:hypothetical protein